MDVHGKIVADIKCKEMCIHRGIHDVKKIKRRTTDDGEVPVTVIILIERAELLIGVDANVIICCGRIFIQSVFKGITVFYVPRLIKLKGVGESGKTGIDHRHFPVFFIVDLSGPGKNR